MIIKQWHGFQERTHSGDQRSVPFLKISTEKWSSSRFSTYNLWNLLIELDGWWQGYCLRESFGIVSCWHYLEKYLNLKLGSVTSIMASSIWACFIAHSGYSFEPFVLQRYFEITTESAKKPSSNFAQGIWCFGFKVSYHSDRCSPVKESTNLFQSTLLFTGIILDLNSVLKKDRQLENHSLFL